MEDFCLLLVILSKESEQKSSIWSKMSMDEESGSEEQDIPYYQEDDVLYDPHSDPRYR